VNRFAKRRRQSAKTSLPRNRQKTATRCCFRECPTECNGPHTHASKSQSPDATEQTENPRVSQHSRFETQATFAEDAITVASPRTHRSTKTRSHMNNSPKRTARGAITKDSVLSTEPSVKPTATRGNASERSKFMVIGRHLGSPPSNAIERLTSNHANTASKTQTKSVNRFRNINVEESAFSASLRRRRLPLHSGSANYNDTLHHPPNVNHREATNISKHQHRPTGPRPIQMAPVNKQPFTLMNPPSTEPRSNRGPPDTPR